MKNYLVALFAVALTACGGGGGSESPSTSNNASQGTDNKLAPADVTAQLGSSYVELHTYTVTYNVSGDEKGMSELKASISIPEIAYFEQVSLDTTAKSLSFSVPELTSDTDASLLVSWIVEESGNKVQRSLDLPFIAKDNGMKLSEMFNIKDAAFATCVDGYIYSSDLTAIHCEGVVSLDGIENLTELTELTLRNSELKGDIKLLGSEKLRYFEISNDTLKPIGKVDLSRAPSIETIRLFNADLSGLTLADNSALRDIYINEGNLKSLDLSKTSSLERVELLWLPLTELILPDASPLTFLRVPGCYKSQGCEGVLTALDLKNNDELLEIVLEYQGLSTLDLSNQIKLKTINLTAVPLEYMDFSKNTNLDYVNIGSFYDRTIEVNGLTNKPKLAYLDASYAKLKSIDLSGSNNLEELRLNNNFLTELNLTNFDKLTTLELYDNQLSSLDISGADSIVELHASSNSLESLSVSHLTMLTSLSVSDNKIATLDLSNNTELTSLFASQNKLSQLDLSKNSKLSFALYLASNPLVSLSVNANNKITTLDLQSTNLNELQPSNFKAMTSFSISGGSIESLDFSQVPELSDVSLASIGLKSINLANNKSLKTVNLFGNELVELDISNAENIEVVEISHNQISSIAIGNVSSITEFRAYQNQLSAIDLNGADNLKTLVLSQNNLKSWNTQLPNITHLELSDNSLTSFSTGISEFLEYIDLRANDISSLEVTGVPYLKQLHIGGNPFLALNIDTQAQQVLEVLDLSYSKLTSLAQFNAPKLISLYASNSDLNSVSLDNFPEVESIGLSNTKISSIEIPEHNQIKSMSIDGTLVTQFDFQNLTSLESFYGGFSYMNRVSGIDGINNKEAQISLIYSPLSASTRAYLAEMVAQGYTNISY
ncbi:leucine-rich repeat domain-containing protein [Pseudoalteromonas luteoviolacea]|uniref:Leucine-rich repeat (LRR) protein n=1 Tax=Pseudoalteromonas luteoviolacea (strain 2ta16) TaxID=1353533 RepID=V4HR96_PSEL2|nr:hypothetical protein [Pseudoalteromonas luteoviolacea]ESP90439.1 leucine-rich repeat (LRR) protein [Pseudoalteromonas luteoviolacea 2ta16]KZN41993.1 hypothetical protein N483_15080 [Pseudoalteromonas luteoviolacea NCIMB 1944]